MTQSNPWDGPGTTPPNESPSEPEPTPSSTFTPPSEARPQWTQAALGPVGPATPSRWFEPDPPPVQPPSVRGRSTAGMLAMLFSVALVAAALGSGGTYLALDASGALQRTVAPSNAASAPASTAANETVNIDEQSATTHAAAVVGPAVVTITSRQINPNTVFGSQAVTGVGSGVIFNKNGWILTNRHVVCGAQQLQVSLADGRTFTGHVYGVDTLTDLAIVKVDATNLPVAPLGNSATLKQGQLAVAIGSPLGQFTNSVTAGVISASNRNIQVADDCNPGQTVTVHNLLQTDAAINPGNSGGALVDSAAQVIGINTAVAGNAQGIGFAIPIDIAKPIIRQALAGQPLSRPYIGVLYVPLDMTIATQNKLPIDYGAWIEPNSGTGSPPIAPGSPAEKAGLRANDIITAVDGQRIDAQHDLTNVLLAYRPGESITLSVLRGGQTLKLTLTLGTRPAGLAG